MSRVTLRAVPWYDWREWAAVRADIFDKSRSAVRRALKKIGVWRCRAKLPLAVESTADLQELIISDQPEELIAYDARSRSTTETALLYGMVITRMVNAFTDTLQRKHQYAQSVRDLARVLDMPENIVALRHSASHGRLPALGALRTAAQQALEWLRRTYWDQQATFLDRVHQELDDTRRLVETILRKYQDVQRRHDQVQRLQRRGVSEAARALVLRRRRLVLGLARAAAADQMVLTSGLLPPLAQAIFGSDDTPNLVLARWHPMLRILRDELPAFSHAMLAHLLSVGTTRSSSISPDKVMEQADLFAQVVEVLLRHVTYVGAGGLSYVLYDTLLQHLVHDLPLTTSARRVCSLLVNIGPELPSLRNFVHYADGLMQNHAGRAEGVLEVDENNETALLDIDSLSAAIGTTFTSTTTPVATADAPLTSSPDAVDNAWGRAKSNFVHNNRLFVPPAVCTREARFLPEQLDASLGSDPGLFVLLVPAVQPAATAVSGMDAADLTEHRSTESVDSRKRRLAEPHADDLNRQVQVARSQGEEARDDSWPSPPEPGAVVSLLMPLRSLLGGVGANSEQADIV